MEERQEIIHAINDKFAEISTETVLFHQALADILGFHITDHRCMHFLHKYGAMPAGRLSELTGLTTSAVTGIIDRLEQAGYARRTNDPKVRRRTIVEPVRNNKLERKLEAIFTPFHEKMHKLLSMYSDSELTFLLDVMTKTIELTHEQSKKLRQRQSIHQYKINKEITYR
ncbi:MAG TPA: MarR family transcriptional regulator [Nitrososphaera sp.]|nr:MarR family transcriptional regulator [Nitrososphaera sp.]